MPFYFDDCCILRLAVATRFAFLVHRSVASFSAFPRLLLWQGSTVAYQHYIIMHAAHHFLYKFHSSHVFLRMLGKISSSLDLNNFSSLVLPLWPSPSWSCSGGCWLVPRLSGRSQSGPVSNLLQTLGIIRDSYLIWRIPYKTRDPYMAGAYGTEVKGHTVYGTDVRGHLVAQTRALPLTTPVRFPVSVNAS